MPFDTELQELGIIIDTPAEQEIEVITQDDITAHVEDMADMLIKLTESDFIFMVKSLIEKYDSLD